jgi:hypothetical protein
MAKSLPASGAGALRIILKNKEDFHFDLRSKTEDKDRTNYIYDVFYENASGTMNIATRDGKIIICALNLSLGKVITLDNDTSLIKLARYVLEKSDDLS